MQNQNEVKPEETEKRPVERAAQTDHSSGANASKEKKKVDIKKEIISWILTLGTAVIIAFVIKAVLFEPIRVDGASMNDTLANGEIMFVTKPEYLFGDPQVGDVVICRYPERKEYFVKRLMGVPGDVLEIKPGIVIRDGEEIIQNIVYRNGEAVDESYLSSERNDNGFSMRPFTLGEGEYFVMGDNRDNSHDSRNLNYDGTPVALTRDQIVGHVRFVVFPFDRIRTVE